MAYKLFYIRIHAKSFNKSLKSHITLLITYSYRLNVFGIRDSGSQKLLPGAIIIFSTERFKIKIYAYISHPYISI